MPLPRSNEFFFLEHFQSGLTGQPFKRPDNRRNPWFTLHPRQWDEIWFVKPGSELRKVETIQEFRRGREILERNVVFLTLPTDHAIASRLLGNKVDVVYGEIPIKFDLFSGKGTRRTRTRINLTYEGPDFESSRIITPWQRFLPRTVASGPSDVL